MSGRVPPAPTDSTTIAWICDLSIDVAACSTSGCGCSGLPYPAIGTVQDETTWPPPPRLTTTSRHSCGPTSCHRANEIRVPQEARSRTTSPWTPDRTSRGLELQSAAEVRSFERAPWRGRERSGGDGLRRQLARPEGAEHPGRDAGGGDRRGGGCDQGPAQPGAHGRDQTTPAARLRRGRGLVAGGPPRPPVRELVRHVCGPRGQVGGRQVHLRQEGGHRQERLEVLRAGVARGEVLLEGGGLVVVEEPEHVRRHLVVGLAPRARVTHGATSWSASAARSAVSA